MLVHVPSTDMEEAGFLPVLKPATRGPSRGLGFTFVKLSCRSSLFTVYAKYLKLNIQIFQLPALSTLVNISISGLFSSLS